LRSSVGIAGRIIAVLGFLHSTIIGAVHKTGILPVTIQILLSASVIWKRLNHHLLSVSTKKLLTEFFFLVEWQRQIENHHENKALSEMQRNWKNRESRRSWRRNARSQSQIQGVPAEAGKQDGILAGVCL
jgi:hypothetical protein